ncbi:MAG: SgcJ/EcaC family oxidoreductase [Chloroflexi bacterium]|nr:SgcJ/EcaC family oxidoreductase [Chloroflexota bacterium]
MNLAEQQAIETNEALETIAALYRELLEAWNRQDACSYAALFSEDANLIGFDGSQVDGSAAIEAHLSGIFAHHRTARYVWQVREIRYLTPEIALLRGVAGMIPPGKSDLMPERNAIQTLVAEKYVDEWGITLFQNTPARFDGRPEAVEALTNELRQLV